jgi:anti-sigma B factor antagonist
MDVSHLTDQQRVIDFYRSTGPSCFGAVVSTRRSGSGRPESESARTLVTIVGELDVFTAPLLRDCLDRIDGDVDVDCSGLEFVDARGLAVLASARARCGSERTLALIEPAPYLLRLLRITGLDATLEVRRDAALVR